VFIGLARQRPPYCAVLAHPDTVTVAFTVHDDSPRSGGNAGNDRASQYRKAGHVPAQDEPEPVSAIGDHPLGSRDPARLDTAARIPGLYGHFRDPSLCGVLWVRLPGKAVYYIGQSVGRP